MKRDKGETFKVPGTARAGGKNNPSRFIKEPPYQDLPADPTRPPHG